MINRPPHSELTKLSANQQDKLILNILYNILSINIVLKRRGASLRLKGKIYRVCVQKVLIYGSETWAMKREDMQRLDRTEMMMVRWMCGVSLKARNRSVDLRERLGITGVAEVVERGRL